MKFKPRFPFLFLMLILFVNCGTTGATISTLAGDDDVDFASYKAFYLLPEPPTEDNPIAVKSFPRRLVERAVIRELKLKNYKEVKDIEAADMLVAIQFSLKDEERTYTTTSTNSTYGNGRYGGYGGYGGYGYRDYYGYRTFSNTTTSTHTAQFRKGNMIIDIIDKKDNALIWEAFAEGKGETEMDAIEEKVNRVVAEIFTNYPLVIAEQ